MPKQKKLNQWFATAIAGNGVFSSILYVSGITVFFAGVYAPVILFVVAGVLYLYKKVYVEVVEALPINGGVYNCLLNGTSKTIAAAGGIMTFLSYLATAVISAKVAMDYLHVLIPGLPVVTATVVLLGVVALLAIAGVHDSAKVALVICSVHVVVAGSFIVLGGLYAVSGESYFWSNLLQTNLTARNLWLGFSVALLSMAGFESAANFVEEQAKGVFRKTLRNLLIGITVANPLIVLVLVNSLPLETIASAQEFVLAEAAWPLGGSWFQAGVVIDACLVLTGAVLASYVGVSGLLSRMAADAAIPNWFSQRNRRESYPRIVIVFLVLCGSILLITRGELLSLAGLYTIAFLGVMTLFGFGNLILRETRTELKRTYQAPLAVVCMASIATIIGIVGNISLDPNSIVFFFTYFIPAVTIVFMIIYQDRILKYCLHASRGIQPLHNYLLKHFNDMISGRFVVFVRYPAKLFTVMEYITRNENGWDIHLVCCKDKDNPNLFQTVTQLVPQLQAAGVYPYLNITVHKKSVAFSPQLVDAVSKELGVRKNRMMVGSIHAYHDFEYEDLGGVRVIF